MADESITKSCDACGQSVTYTGHRGFRDAHLGCSKSGQSAVDDTHKACPVHGMLVWVVGPYSTFRACVDRNCHAGKRGKPWRYCAPRGEYYGDRNAPIESDEREVANVIRDDNESQEHPTPTPTPVTPKGNRPVSNNPDLSLKSLGSLGDTIQAYVDERAYQIASELTVEALKDAKLGGPALVEWRVNDKPFAVIEGAHHKALPRLLKLYAAGFRNFLIVGAAGSGKTTLAHSLAMALKLAFGQVSCTAGMSESSLTGRGIPNLTNGQTVYESTDFVRCYEGGGVFLLDEVDAADANVMLVINSALANGHMALPARVESPAATRHTDSVIICAANTWGTGADRQYVGRNQLDAAFLDRFVGTTIEVDYDRDLESALVGDANICARVWTIREKARDLKLRRVVGTRFLMSVARLVKGAGETVDSALTACTVGWTDDERSKVNVKREAN